jgi:hypothetical protein|tara:strand:+ start:205 stop:327 length:123 start_codon:yes stop_codon:yes gene_type:complete
MGIQFDKLNRCAKCQPEKVIRIKKKTVDWEKERESSDSVG